jgi:hypothetical protein
LPTGSKLANLLATRAENGRRRLEEIFPCEGSEPRLGEIGNPCFPCDGEIQPVGEYGNEFPCGESARATIVVDQCIFESLECTPASYFGPLIVSGQTDVTVQQTIFRNNDISACRASTAQVRIVFFRRKSQIAPLACPAPQRCQYLTKCWSLLFQIGRYTHSCIDNYTRVDFTRYRVDNDQQLFLGK